MLSLVHELSKEKKKGYFTKVDRIIMNTKGSKGKT